MQRDSRHGWGGLVRPDLINRVGRTGHQCGTDFGRTLPDACQAVFGMQGRVIAQTGIGGQSLFEPLMGWFIHQMALFKQADIGLIARLFGIAPIDKQSRAVLKRNRHAP